MDIQLHEWNLIEISFNHCPSTSHNDQMTKHEKLKTKGNTKPSVTLQFHKENCERKQRQYFHQWNIFEIRQHNPLNIKWKANNPSPYTLYCCHINTMSTINNLLKILPDMYVMLKWKEIESKSKLFYWTFSFKLWV